MQGILVLSNGYGEDEIAAAIIKEIKGKDSSIDIYALPLVGLGLIYNNAPVKKLGPTKLMPSGGLVPSNHLKMLLGDIKAGFLGLTIGQIASILKARNGVDLTLSVGDAYPVILNSFFARKKQIFVGTAKSNYFCPYSAKEKALFKKYCAVTFPRDEITNQDLLDYGVRAEYAGNVMMDCVKISGYDLGVKYPEVAVGILPGSRSDVYRDFSTILEAVEVLSKKVKWGIKYFTALASSVDLGDLVSEVINLGWELVTTGRTEGIVAHLEKGSIKVYLTRGIFGDILNASHIILGQAGTANEQAAGLGKPVIAFAEDLKDENLGWYRLRQKGLLGDGLTIVKKDPEKIAKEVIDILENPTKYDHISKAGKQRMGATGAGAPGAAKKIAERIIEEFYV